MDVEILVEISVEISVEVLVETLVDVVVQVLVAVLLLVEDFVEILLKLPRHCKAIEANQRLAGISRIWTNYFSFMTILPLLFFYFMAKTSSLDLRID